VSNVIFNNTTIFTYPIVHLFQFKDGEFRSNAEKLISKVPVIEVEGYTAICTGGGGALGHPTEYIQLNTVTPGEVATCKYCGLRFVHKHGSGGHHH
jgi:NADH dehydrogenase (ubiquinone) Fe-S protein 6